MKNIILFLTLFSIISCQESKREYSEIEFKIDSFEWDPDPYKFSNYIQDSVVPAKGSQMASWDYSYIGDIEKMHVAWDAQMNKGYEVTQALRDSFAMYERHDALQYIIEQAKDERVVIINEAHHMPQHRIFTTQLLEGLKQQGFKHLGMETYFGSPKVDSTILANGYPTMQIGYYTKEPQFGNLVREAHQSGYKLFGYESQGHDDGKGREINQAKNIKDYLEKHPNEKVIIHCGFDHALEGELTSSWGKAMAGRLKEYTDIDPLTINQTVFSERSKREYENVFYQMFDHKTPSVFTLNDKLLSGRIKNGGTIDIFVFQPRSNNTPRPEWMVYNDRKEYKLSFEEADIQCPCLVFAYKEGEAVGSAIPYDVQETKNKNCTLVLNETNFNIVISGQNGKTLQTEVKK